MDEEWPQQYGDLHNDDLHNEIALAIASGDNQMVQHGHITDEMDGLLGDQGDGYAANAAAADQGNSGGQARSGKKTGSGHYRGRHNRNQIQQLEAAFRQDSNPDEKIRLDLSKSTGLSIQQVQIWFQNRRSSGKSKAKQKETEFLKEENDRLKAEKQELESAHENKICPICRGEGTPELRALHAENLKLKDKYMRASAYLKTVSGGRAQVIDGKILLADEDASVVTEEHPAPPPPSHEAPLTAMDPVMLAHNGIAHNNHETAANTFVIQQHAACALEEFKALVRLGEPMWSLAHDGEVEVINYHLYMETMFPGMSEHYQMEFSSDGTRKTGIITCTATDLIGVLMDAEWWRMMFPGIVASATTSKIIAPGASRHGLIQMMTAELRVLSPRVPVRKINFVRQCQRLQPKIWAVVDVSIDGILEQDVAPSTHTACRLLPSGCYIEELDSGYCKVTWIVNMEHDGATVPPLHHPLFRSGWALGACRWIASLQRRCEYIAFLHSNCINNTGAITPDARRNILDVAHRMTTSFYQALCSPGSQPCSSVDEWSGCCGTGADRFKVAVRVVTFCSGSATVLRATSTVWLPGIPSERVFNYLCDKDRRIEWDIVANGATILQEGCFSTGQLQGNAVSLLRTVAPNGTNSKLILQESCSDASCMVLTYAPIDEKYMHDVMNNGGRTSFSLVPSGLVVLPDGHTEPGVAPIPAVSSSSSSSSSATRHKTNAGSLVSSMYQTQLRGQPPENLSKAVADNVGNLICHAIKNIKSAVKARVVLAA